jgi:hypothetical protein
MLTQTRNVQYNIPKHSTIVLLENDTVGNSTANINFSSNDSSQQSPDTQTIAERAAIIFTDPIESLTVIVLGIIANVASIIAVLKFQ